MGWNPFKSKKKTVVGTSVSRMVEEQFIGDTARESMLRAMLGGTNVSEELVQGLLQGPTIRMNRYFEYGKKHYTYGLPNASLRTRGYQEADVIAAIKADTGRTATILYADVTPANNLHLAREYLVHQWGYDPITNEAKKKSQEKGTPVYVNDIVPILSPETLRNAPELIDEQLGPPPLLGFSYDRIEGQAVPRVHSVPVVDDVNNREGAMIQFIWRTVSQEPIPVAERIPGGPVERTVVRYHYETLFYSITHIDLKAQYLQVGYSYQVNGETRRDYYTYQLGLRPVRHPRLEMDGRINTRAIPGEYFPFLFFRRHRKSVQSSAGQKERESATKLAKLLSLDFKEVSDAIHQNGDIDKVEQAVLMLGVPIHSQDPVEQAYLFEFFDELYRQGSSGPGFAGGMLGSRSLFGKLKTPTGNVLHLRDADFDMQLGYEWIERSTVPGKIGKKGSYTSAQGTKSSSQGSVYALMSELRGGGDSAVFGIARTLLPVRGTGGKGMTFRKQITDSSYIEIRVSDPVISYDVYEGHKVHARPGDEEMLIPINRLAANKLPTAVRDKLYLKSLHFIFNSRDTVKVKWYQRGAFKVLMVIAAVVISIYFQLPVYQLAVALTATTLAAVALTVVLTIALSIGLEAAFTFVAKQLGFEAATILAIMAIMYGGYQAFHHGSISGAPWASELISAGTNLASTANTLEMREKITNVMQEYESFQEQARQQWEELSEIQKELYGSMLIDPFQFIGRAPAIVVGEDPDDFYNRTVHSGNIGVLSLDAISMYTETRLQLPSPATTLGDVFYG